MMHVSRMPFQPRKSLKIYRTPRAASKGCREMARPLVLVPTMGALHRGHAALIDRARSLAGANGSVVVSIFVNPAQFGPSEDLSRYPHSFEADRALCAEHGADAIFHPDPAHMYPEGYSTWVDEASVSKGLCGSARPGHFRGVCTVVLKLFQIVAPGAAVFGLKDFQQCMVLRRMARDLNSPVRMEFVETAREADGLALSSRNSYLSAEERKQAVVLRQALLLGRAAWKGGERKASAIRRIVRRTIDGASLANVDYIDIVDADTLVPVRIAARQFVIAVAVFFGSTRLIDNIWIH